jgi:phosphate transport system permease protein
MTSLKTPPKFDINRTPSLWEQFKRGDHLVWMTGGMLGLALIMISGLLYVVLANGLGYFWPSRLTQVVSSESGKILGTEMQRETFRRAEKQPDGSLKMVEGQRSQFKIGNRDLFGIDFVWSDHSVLSGWTQPREAVALERWEYGDFYGYLKEVRDGDRTVASGAAAWDVLRKELGPIVAVHKKMRDIEKNKIGEINYRIQQAEFDIVKIERGRLSADEREAKAEGLRQIIRAQKEEFAKRVEEVGQMRVANTRWVAVMETADGKEKLINLDAVVRAIRPNDMGFFARLLHYGCKVWEYIFDEPREANTEGGVFPAIFGTVMMTVLMALLVTPFGVLSALYLREYAHQGVAVRMVRIAVNNLAGVPSIVFGIFGLGFFVYTLGGSIDALFFPERLPTPTYGTGGILWASLTLAILTIPVVIVATEESIAAVPRGAKEGSLALGASKFQTICRIVLPASVPGILTGVILAMARGAGEVAPLMITGVVKLAPELPFDDKFPFFHLERKFMHLGFHIYDVGFQSPNVEAAKPMVFVTTLLLLAVVVGLNVIAIRLRDRIRKKYQTGAFS